MCVRRRASAEPMRPRSGSAACSRQLRVRGPKSRLSPSPSRPVGWRFFNDACWRASHAQCSLCPPATVCGNSGRDIYAIVAWSARGAYLLRHIDCTDSYAHANAAAAAEADGSGSSGWWRCRWRGWRCYTDRGSLYADPTRS